MRIERWIFPLAVFGLLTTAGLRSTDAADDEADKPKVKLPQAVKKAVKAAYPTAKIVGSSKEKDDEGETVYEVELMVKGKSIDLIIDPEGEIEETEKEIDPADLPKAVTKAISKAMPKAKIKKVEEVTSEDDKVVYEIVLVGKGKKMIEMVVAPNGKILESAAASEEDEDEDDDKPKAKKKAEAEDEDDDKPKAKKKAEAEDEDDDKPKAKKKAEAEDEDDDKPAKKGKKEMDDEDDDEDEDD